MVTDPRKRYYDSINNTLRKNIESSTGGNRDILLTNYEIMQDIPYSERVEVLKLFKMLSNISGMSDILAWETTVKVARKLAAQI